MPVRISQDINGAIAVVTIPRPAFTSDVRSSMPLKAGEDRRHAVAWVVLRDLIIKDLTGQTLGGARDYLAARGITVEATAKGIIAGVTTLAARAFNDKGNLRPGPSAQNRILGARINGAKSLMELPESTFPRTIEMNIVDEDGSTSKLKWTLENRRDAIDLFFNMALDWNNAADVQQGQATFTSLIESSAAGTAGPRDAITPDGSGSARSRGSTAWDEDDDTEMNAKSPTEHSSAERQDMEMGD